MNRLRSRHIWPGPAVAAAALIVGGGTVAASSDDEPEEAAVAFTSPADGATIAGSVPLAMTADGITIEAAGDVYSGAGHFHVIADAGCVASGDSITRDADHVHFGGGQDAGLIYLEPGTHELCLQVGDGIHTALDITDTVMVDVGVTNLDEWCAVIDEVDELFEATDTSDDEFAVRQVDYENIRRLIAQLVDGLDHVPTAARVDVDTSLGFATDIVTALITAADETTAEEAVESVFSSFAPWEDLPGADWVAAECGTDISG
jgi:hypothetical protein